MNFFKNCLYALKHAKFLFNIQPVDDNETPDEETPDEDTPDEDITIVDDTDTANDDDTTNDDDTVVKLKFFFCYMI